MMDSSPSGPAGRRMATALCGAVQNWRRRRRGSGGGGGGRAETLLRLLLSYMAALSARLVRRIRLDLQPRRLLSVPHLLVFGWVLVLLWGERWVFDSRVRGCDWDHWEDWPSGATPHRLVLIADPQLIDPHTYPGRGWPISSLTYTVTDNYLRRSFAALEHRLAPDSTIFLGDLFDGGREWTTAPGGGEVGPDPPWGGRRPAAEARQVERWNRLYRHDFWVAEYNRFIDIFVRSWNRASGASAGPWQRGRRLIASLPGNHDVGFGSQVRLPARDRFGVFFGEPNRVDVIGNHTIVSVDGPSLAAGTSADATRPQVRPIYEPVHAFLKTVRRLKRRAVERELRFWHGRPESAGLLPHAVADVESLHRAELEAEAEVAAAGDPHMVDLPTIILTHVPLYRPPDTPCGPLREHWPPSSSAGGGGRDGDPRNAISVSGGYQYQNVLDEADSRLLVRSVGNVVAVFSGDDHDYCEVVHRGPDVNGVHEITVKSVSMAMGVPTPAFLAVSLYNPVDRHGAPLRPDGRPTIQTHLCLLPNQLAMYTRYVALGVVTIVMLGLRALLVPTLRLDPFALDPDPHHDRLLPLHRDHDRRDDDGHHLAALPAVAAAATYSGRGGGGGGGGGTSRARSGSLLAPPAPAALSHPSGRRARSPPLRKARKEVRIDFSADDLDAYHDEAKSRIWRPAAWRRGGGGGGGWAGGRGSSGLRIAAREWWASVFRVGWMAGLFWVYLTWRG